jgi:hypothetical protein
LSSEIRAEAGPETTHALAKGNGTPSGQSPYRMYSEAG